MALNNIGQDFTSIYSDKFVQINELPIPIQSIQVVEIDQGNGESVLGGKRKLTSTVWNHFKRQKINDKWKAICNYCKKQLGGDPKNGTKHLHDHFAICPSLKTRDVKETGLNYKADMDEKNLLDTYTFDQAMARKELATMIILHEYPLQMVEHYGFRKFVAALQPLFKAVSQNAVQGDILKIYEFEKSKAMKLFEENGSRFAITTNMWTSSNQNKNFMVITAHFIDDSWTLQSRIVRFINVPCPHTSDVLCDVLTDCLMDWKLDQKLSTLTLDNCFTNDSLLGLTMKKLSSDSLLLDGRLLHMRCCVHILNLIVEDGLKVIGVGIGKVRDCVAYWVATTKRYQIFEETARQLKIDCTEKLALDCKSRWNSTFFMLNVAIYYKDVFSLLKQHEPLFKCSMVEKDWEMARQICDRLKLFHSVTEVFSRTTYPTANLYFPKLCEIRVALNEWLTCGVDYIQAMAANMIDNFNKYWFQIHDLMGVAVVLDPRYKLKLLQYYFPIIYGDLRSIDEIGRIRKLCYDLLAEYSSKSRMTWYNGFYSQSSNDIFSESSVTDVEDGDPMSKYDLFIATESNNKNVKDELDNYLEERVIPRKVDLDILAWWKNAYKYPTLQMIARDILAIPVSTVASESTFSTSGRFVSPHHDKLPPNTLEALMCAQEWLWAEIKGSCSTTHSDCCKFYEDNDVNVKDDS